MRDWMKEKRISSSLTQKQVAEALGITESYYGFIESGARQKRLDITIAAQLSTLFRMPLGDIVALEAKEGD